MRVDSRQSTSEIQAEQSKRSTADQPATNEPLPLTGNRSFSSILESVTGAANERRDEPTPDREASKPHDLERSQDDRDGLKSEDNASAAVPLIRIVDEAPLLDVQATSPPAREILPAADLQNLLLTVETQL